MSAHLHECPANVGADMRCYCTMLRACEQRVLDEVLPDVRYAAYAAGVQAARDAVADVRASLTFLGAVVVLESINRADALAAIDALRGES